MIPISLCLYNMVPALLQPLGIKTSEMSGAVRKVTTASLQTSPASHHRAAPSVTAAIAHLEPEAAFRDTGLPETSVTLWFAGPWVSLASHRFDPG